MKPRHLIAALLCALLLLFPLLAHSSETLTIAAIEESPARTLSLDEVMALADRGKVNERLYLRGEFRVTASGSSRVVLRDARRPNEQSPRVVVEYPRGVVPPKEGERFVRDAAHPYRVSEVHRGSDGVITIYVREIFAAEARMEEYFK